MRNERCTQAGAVATLKVRYLIYGNDKGPLLRSASFIPSQEKEK